MLSEDMNLYPPEAVQVRNTFIHVASPLSEDVLSSRPAVSCPASQIGVLHKAFQDFAFDIGPMQKDIQKDIREDKVHSVHSVHELASKPVICLESALRFDDSQALGPLGELATPNVTNVTHSGHSQNVDLQWPYVEPHYVEPCYTSPDPSPAVPTVPAPYEPAPGSTELPSVGSRGHYSGDCKPCSFLYAKGCNNGAMCLFCHLCDRSEKKRRQKAKRAALKGGAWRRFMQMLSTARLEKAKALFFTCGLQILCYGYFAWSMAGILYCTNSLDSLDLMSVHSGRQQFPTLHAVFQPDLVSNLREFMRSFAAAHYVHQACGLKMQRKSSDRTAELLADVSGKLVPLSSQLYRPCGP